MKKKILSLLLIASMTMTAFVACGKKETKKEVEPTVTATVEPTKAVEAEPTKEAEVSPTPTVTTADIEAAGSVDGLTYTNSVIGFTITVPDSWLMNNSDETYEYLVNVTGVATDVESFKSMLSQQSVNYLCYGIDTQMSESGGTNNILAQSMLGSLFGGLDVDTIVTSLKAMFEQQFTNMGATTTFSEPVKTSKDNQDVYQMTAKMMFTGEENGTTISQEVTQEYIIFMRNDVLVYMAISSANDESTELAQNFVDTLTFN